LLLLFLLATTLYAKVDHATHRNQSRFDQNLLP
jgi:hypothetical protein